MISLALPLAALDAVAIEEELCRSRLARLLNDFMTLSSRLLWKHSLVIRLLAREEATRRQILEFYSSSMQRLAKHTSKNTALGTLLDKNSFHTRSKYFGKWLLWVAKYAAHGFGSSRTRDIRNLAVRSMVFGRLRLCPTSAVLKANSGAAADAAHARMAMYKGLSILAEGTPEAEQVRISRLMTAMSSLGGVAGEMFSSSSRNVFVGLEVVRHWTRVGKWRKELQDLHWKEAVKRRHLLDAERSKRATLFSGSVSLVHL